MAVRMPGRPFSARRGPGGAWQQDVDRLKPEPLRVIYDKRPYLVTRDEDGTLEHAYGPFDPGTEPSLSECGPEREVRSGVLLAELEGLMPDSPALLPGADTLARG
jgi:hypothetical protein